MLNPWSKPFSVETFENAPVGAGVYIIQRGKGIRRLAGNDPAGTLYVGHSHNLSLYENASFASFVPLARDTRQNTTNCLMFGSVLQLENLERCSVL